MMNRLMITFRLAWRNLWRNHRRTFIMLTAIIIGVWAMIFMTALMRGMVNEMVRDAIRVLPGHVQIHHPEYLDDPNVVNGMPIPTGDLLDMLEGDQVTAWPGRVRVPAVISSERESRGVTLLGIEPESEGRVSFIADAMVEGRFLEDGGDKGIVIGAKLAESLETELGKRIVIMSQDPDNEIADRGFRIVGIFETSPESVEETFAFTGIDTARQFLRIGDQIHEIAVMGRDFREVEGLTGAVTDAAGPVSSVKPWSQLDRYLGSMLGFMDGFVLVWFVVVFLALSFGLVNTLVMAVFERVREIGLMLALGMKPAMILGQIIVESAMLLFLGLIAGNLIAWLTVVPLKDGIDLSVVAEGLEMFGSGAVLYPEMTAWDVTMANIIVLALGAVASLLPAVRASRYRPIEALTTT